MVGICLEARAGYLFFMAPTGGAVCLEPPKNLVIHVRIVNLFFHIIFEYRSFLSTKTSEIRKQRHIQNAFRSTNKSKFSRGRSPEPPPPLTRRGWVGLSCSPLSCLRSCSSSPDHFLERGDGPEMEFKTPELE